MEAAFMSLEYIGSYTFVQIGPPEWSKHFAGQVDTASLVFQGAQYLEKAFLNALTKFMSMTYIDEKGVSTTDTGMRFADFTSDGKAILPSVTLQFTGCRGGTIPDAVPEDDLTIQSASSTFVITGATSPNVGKAITMNVQYRAARTNYEWAQLSDPDGTPTHATVRIPLSYSGPYGDPNFITVKFSGMVDASGDPSNTISTADATEVWNSFAGTSTTPSFSAKEVVPGHVWACSSSNDFLLVGI